jgi:hypothetical protein
LDAGFRKNDWSLKENCFWKKYFCDLNGQHGWEKDPFLQDTRVLVRGWCKFETNTRFVLEDEEILNKSGLRTMPGWPLRKGDL